MQLEFLVGIGGMMSATSFVVGGRAALETLAGAAKTRGRAWTLYGLHVSAAAMLLWMLLAESGYGGHKCRTAPYLLRPRRDLDAREPLP
jgi:hypothetical protein